MNLARVSSKGEITIPAEIRKKLNLKDGDKVIFIEQDDKVMIENASLQAFEEFQKAMSEEAKKQGLTEDDILKLCKETRQELWEERYAHLFEHGEGNYLNIQDENFKGMPISELSEKAMKHWLETKQNRQNE